MNIAKIREKVHKQLLSPAAKRGLHAMAMFLCLLMQTTCSSTMRTCRSMAWMVLAASVATALLVHPDPDHGCLRCFLCHEKLHLLQNLCERRGLTCRTHKRPTVVVYHNAAKICHHLLQTNRINYTAVDDGGGRWRTTYYQTLMFYHYLYENAPSTVKWSRTTGEWFMAGVSEYDRKTGAAYHLDYLLS